MKNHFFLALSVAALGLSSCYDEPDEAVVSTTDGDNTITSGCTVTLSATSEASSEGLSKTAIVDGVPQFSGGEALAVYSEKSKYKTIFQSVTEAGPTAEFTATLSGDNKILGSKEYYGILPETAVPTLYKSSETSALIRMGLPSAQTAVKNGIDPAAHLLVSATTSDSKAFSFRSVCAYLKVYVDEPVEELTITSTGDAIEGYFNVTINSDNTFAISEVNKQANTITLSGLEKGYYYVSVIPGTYSLQIDSKLDEGTTVSKTLSEKTTVSNKVYSFNLKGGVILPMDVLKHYVGEDAASVSFLNAGADTEGYTEVTSEEGYTIPSKIHIYRSSDGKEFILTSDKGFQIQAPESCADMFNGYSALKSAVFTNFNTEKVTDFGGMFYGCSALSDLDVSGLNTSKALTMSCMFRDCASLTSIDVSGFNTSEVTNISNLFENCTNLTSIDVSNFNTSKAENMAYMFANCSGLKTLDISNLDTRAVTKMEGMFRYSVNLETLDISGFDTEEVTNMGWMFYHCTALKTIYSDGFALNGDLDSQYMFQDCTSLPGYGGTKYDASYAKVASDGGYFTAKTSK